MPLFALNVLVFALTFLITFFLLGKLDVKLFQQILNLRYDMPEIDNGSYYKWPFGKQAAYLSHHTKIVSDWERSPERKTALVPLGSLYLWCRAKLLKQPWPEPNPPFQWLERPTLKVVGRD